MQLGKGDAGGRAVSKVSGERTAKGNDLAAANHLESMLTPRNRICNCFNPLNYNHAKMIKDPRMS